MKHQIQELKKFNIPCVESVIREKLESKSGLLHFRLKKNSTASTPPSNSTKPQHHNSTSVITSSEKKHQQKPLLGEQDDESQYSRAGAHKKHEHIRPSAQPQVTQVIQNIILHHDDNRFMKSLDVTGTGKSNIEQNEDYERFVGNQQQPVLQNTNYYQQNGNLQNSYGAYNNPYSMYWKKKN